MSGAEKDDEFDMDFGEALERLSGTDPREVADVAKADMSDDTIEDYLKAFEACGKRTDDGEEYWRGRDLLRLFEYGEWRFFRKAVERAVTACNEAGNDPNHHFVQTHEMVELGSGATREVEDFLLTRYACYLTAMNADSKKRPVAFAQTYFAIQARRQELADEAVAVPVSEDEKRVYLRNQIKEHNKYLSSAAKDAGVVTPLEFSIFHAKGYQGLYGMNKKEIARRKGLPKSADILDRMGSTELAANFFRVTQTEEKLRKEGIRGKEKAYQTHYEVGRQVRDAMLKISGIAPEDLKPADSIKKAEKRLRLEQATTVIPEIAAEPTPEPTPPVLSPIDLRKDLWKYALLVIVQQPNMEMSTSDLIAELLNYIAVPNEASKTLQGRKDNKFSQLVRNLKSHKTSKTNFIYLGYAETIDGGFRATEKGLQFVKEYFADRL